MTIAVQTLTVTAGRFRRASIPPDLTLDVPGSVTLTGGSGDEAYALIRAATSPSRRAR